MKLQASPVKQFALAHGIPVAQPRSLRLDGKYPDDATQARDALRAAGAEALVVAAYGLILPQWVLDLPPLGCLNIHASLLPRWRGAAPIHRAIEAGDTDTGITIMQMDAGLDTGDMLAEQRLPIAADETTARLHDRLAALGGPLVAQVLAQAARGALRPVRQPAEGVTYAHKIEKAEAAIDWSLPAAAIARRVRAFDPFPGASATLQGETVKVWACESASASDSGDGGEAAGTAAAAPAGTVLQADAQGIVVQCGQGVLRATVLQRPGGKRLPAAELLRGWPVAPGLRSDAAAAQGSGG